MLNSTPWEALFPWTIGYKKSEIFLQEKHENFHSLQPVFIPDLNNSANLNSGVFQSYTEH